MHIRVQYTHVLVLGARGCQKLIQKTQNLWNKIDKSANIKAANGKIGKNLTIAS